MDKITIVRKSYARCMRKHVIAQFYDNFLKSHPAIAPLFANTDFEVQEKRLQHGIQLAIMYVDGNVLGENGLKRIHVSHGKAQMNIPHELYRYWKASFLKAVRDTDPEFSEEIRGAWDVVLQQTIDYIVEGE